MQFQVQQLASRMNQLQRELASISSQLSNLSSIGSQQFSGGPGGMGYSQGWGSYGSGQGLGSSIGQGISGQGYSYPQGGYGFSGMGGPSGMSSGSMGGSQFSSGGWGSGQYHGSMTGGGSQLSGMGLGTSGSMGGYPSNIVSHTRPSATAGFSEVESSPTGRQDYGIGSSNQAFMLGQ